MFASRQIEVRLSIDETRSAQGQEPIDWIRHSGVHPRQVRDYQSAI